MEIKVQTLSPESFAPFGEVIARPERLRDAAGPSWTWWAENAYLPADQRAYGVGYLDLQLSTWQFDWAERHMQSVEVLIPTGGDCLVYVAPPDNLDEPGKSPLEDQYRVFRVIEGQGVILKKGVWHGAPLALDKPIKVIVLLLQGTGERDVFLIRFPNTPISIKT
ncbi:MAG: ureidoglycolate lyase [Chloroflexi bacterium]|nr:ureidoglycolate lyase [Chloroflexota bacterium]